MWSKLVEDGLEKIRKISPQHPENIAVHFNKNSQGLINCRLSLTVLGKRLVAQAAGRRRLIAFHAAQRKLVNIIGKRKDAVISAKRKRQPISLEPTHD